MINDNVLQALEMTGKGMIGIFTVIGIIALAVVLLGKLTNKNQNR